MRLIDADAIMIKFADFAKSSNNSDFAKTPTWDDAVSIVDSQPTSYDVDKVVEQIKKVTDEHGFVDYINDKSVIKKEKAIEIVKAGGVNENDDCI